MAEKFNPIKIFTSDEENNSNNLLIQSIEYINVSIKNFLLIKKIF